MCDSGGWGRLKNAHADCPVKPLSAYSLNKYGLGEADLLVQVHTVLEQPCVTSHCILDHPVLARRPVEVPVGPIIDPSLNVSMKGLVFHTDRIVEDMRHHDRTEELEVGEVETITYLDVGQLRPLHTGPGCIKDCLLFWVARGAEESKTRVTVLHWVTMSDCLEGVLDEHHGFAMNTRGFWRRRGQHWGDGRAWSLLKPTPSLLIHLYPPFLHCQETRTPVTFFPYSLAMDTPLFLSLTTFPFHIPPNRPYSPPVTASSLM